LELSQDVINCDLLKVVLRLLCELLLSRLSEEEVGWLVDVELQLSVTVGLLFPVEEGQFVKNGLASIKRNEVR
jgi:hypothetical protein